MIIEPTQKPQLHYCEELLKVAMQTLSNIMGKHLSQYIKCQSTKQLNCDLKHISE